MNLEKLKKRKKELKITNKELADRSGVPLSTVNKIFSGATKSPQYQTILALETVLAMYSYSDQDGPYVGAVHEAAALYQVKGNQTADDYYALPDEVRAELIDGRIYYMAAPTSAHQEILGELYYQIKDYIRKRQGGCKVFLSPFDVRLDQDDKTIVQPDLIITCHPDRLVYRGLNGAPDFVIEIISVSTSKRDYSLKMQKYWDAGVQEYWIVDSYKQHIVTYQFHGEDVDMKIHGINDLVTVQLYGDFVIDFGSFMPGVLQAEAEAKAADSPPAKIT